MTDQTTAARAQLEAAANTISVATALLRDQLPTMKALIKESELMESVGPALAPSLYLNSERKAAAAVMVPLCRAAVNFVAAYDAHVAEAARALKTVKAKDGV